MKMIQKTNIQYHSLSWKKCRLSRSWSKNWFVSIASITSWIWSMSWKKNIGWSANWSLSYLGSYLGSVL